MHTTNHSSLPGITESINRLAVLALFLLVLSSFLSLCWGETRLVNQAPHRKIGISQIIDHTALNTVRTGILEALQEQGYQEGVNLTILSENAQGNMALSTQIATKLASAGLDVAVAISTPSAQTLLHAIHKQGSPLPIVFTAVTDPKTAKLEPTETFMPITGISDAPNLPVLVQLFGKLLPHLKKLGLMYNPSESNSVATALELKKLLALKNIEVIEVTVNQTAEVAQAVQTLMGKVDALYFPQDNTIVAALQTVIQIAQQSPTALPIVLPIYSEDPYVTRSVLAMVGYDYRDIGYDTGLLIARILKGDKASEIPIQRPTHLKVLVNQTEAQKLKLIIPEKLEISDIPIIKYH